MARGLAYRRNNLEGSHAQTHPLPTARGPGLQGCFVLGLPFHVHSQPAIWKSRVPPPFLSFLKGQVYKLQCGDKHKSVSSKFASHSAVTTTASYREACSKPQKFCLNLSTLTSIHTHTIHIYMHIHMHTHPYSQYTRKHAHTCIPFLALWSWYCATEG